MVSTFPNRASFDAGRQLGFELVLVHAGEQLPAMGLGLVNTQVLKRTGSIVEPLSPMAATVASL